MMVWVVFGDNSTVLDHNEGILDKGRSTVQENTQKKFISICKKVQAVLKGCPLYHSVAIEGVISKTKCKTKTLIILWKTKKIKSAEKSSIDT